MILKEALIDTNIFFDLALKRARYEKIRQLFTEFSEVSISTNTFTNSFYVLPKSGLSKAEIFDYLKNYKVLPFSELQCFDAYQIATKSEDVEDCMELELAKENGLWFVTADKELAKNYTYKKLALIS